MASPQYMNAVGLGFRRELSSSLLTTTNPPDFIEVAPENWMHVGGRWGKVFREASERYSVNCHGLSLSIGSPDPLDFEHLKSVKDFLKLHDVKIFSEHLSFSKCDNAHLYDLLPIPFREDAITRVIERIQIVQDFLGRQIALENISYYTPVGAEVTEAVFISEILEGANCKLLLDVNNVYVNSVNHSYDPKDFLASIPLDRTVAIHIAGHEQIADDLIIDTHGAPIIDPVYDLLEWSLGKVPNSPILLERDFNIPELPELHAEMAHIREIVSRSEEKRHAA